MNSFKRLFVSIKSQIDQVADDFENHEALAEAAIRDLQDVARKTRLHLHRIGKMSGQYRKQLQAEQEQARLWSERAVKARRDDEQKALQCVRRLRRTRQQIGVLEQQIEEAEAQETRLRDDLNAIQEQLLVLNNKKSILAARGSRAGVRDILQGGESPLREAQTVFERWEGAVVGSEFEMPEESDHDSFAEEFEREEDDLALRMMLDELVEAEIATTKP